MWRFRSGERTIELTIPVAGLGFGLWLLVFARGPQGPAHRPATELAPLRGSVSGVVEDRHGDPIPGARVSLVDDRGETLAEELTMASPQASLTLGEFHLAEVPGGSYTVVASLSGVASRQVHVPVAPGEDTRLTLRLDLGY